MKLLNKTALLTMAAFSSCMLLAPAAQANVCFDNHTDWAFGAHLKAEAVTGDTGKMKVGEKKSLKYQEGMVVNLYKKPFIGTKWHLVNQLYPDSDKAYYEITGTIGKISWTQIKGACHQE